MENYRDCTPELKLEGFTSIEGALHVTSTENEVRFTE